MIHPSSRILVIGGGGFIGRHVVDTLRADGHGVTVLDIVNPPPGDAGGGWITGPISDLTLVAAAAEGCGGVVFLANASLPGSSQADLAREVEGHVAATLEVAETCEAAGVGRFVFASSGGTVYGRDPPEGGLSEDAPCLPLSGYGVSKLAIEHYLRVLGRRGAMRTLSLRLANPYGEGQRALRAQGVVAAAMQHAVEGTVMPIWGDGGVERDFVHIRDVARAFAAALAYEGGESVVNIGSGRAASVNEVVAAVRRHTGRPLKVEYRAHRSVDVRRSLLRIDRARRELGWTPRLDLEAGLERTAAWWRTGAGAAPGRAGQGGR
ncbi:MAG: NAD-dependent epimerase/dehydratase family protein [Hasllibacter sp.]